jgi:predicted TPR repeat methyltransferase
MPETDLAAFHDAYAAEYDAQVAAHDCHVAELMFGLAYERVQPGQRLLDAGIGSGLCARLFAKAGLKVHGMDFSPVMLEICSTKGFAASLKRHDLQAAPWPYADGEFDHVVCCGVLHFIDELHPIFAEVSRVLRNGGLFAFTTRAPGDGGVDEGVCERDAAGPFDIFSHTPAYVDAELRTHGFDRQKAQRCLVGEDVFVLWVAQRAPRQ